MMALREALRIHLSALATGRSDFEDSLALIDRHFDYAPVAFDNGPLSNAAGENEGACRIFAFAETMGLSEQEALTCFGRHYRAVIDDPAGDSHGNIRQFISTGWSGIHFYDRPLRLEQHDQSNNPGETR